MTKIVFDIEKSLEQSPPDYPIGTKFIKRIVMNRNLVTFSDKDQIRVLSVEQAKIPEIRDSFKASGWLNNQPVSTIKVDPNNKNRFVGLSGWHRNASAEALGWETMIYDVLGFDSPRCERVHKNCTNPGGSPYVPVTKQDLVKQVRESIKNKEILNNDKEIKSLINDICPRQTEEYKLNIFKLCRKHISHSTSLRVYRCVGSDEGTTKHYAETFNLPFAGDLRYNETKQLGFISADMTPKTVLYTSKLLSMQYDGQKVKFFAFIDKPIENPKLNDQRKRYLEGFNKFIMTDCLSTQFQLKQLGINIEIEEILNNHPVDFVGFLHQDVSPDPTNNGLPKEYGIVDINGNKINNF